MWKRISLTLSLLPVLVFSIACSDREALPNVNEAIEQSILLLGNGAEPESIDPHLVTGHPDNNIIVGLMEGLIGIHKSDDNEAAPGIAYRWESDENNKVWTFYLREDARWSNGDPITSSDFLYSYQRALTPSLAAEYASLMYLMENAEAYHRGRITDFSKVGVEAIDDHTLRFNLVGPTPHFTNILKHTFWYPLHPPTIEAHGEMGDRVSDWTRPGNYVGSGPYTLEVWEPYKIIKMKRNPHYWDTETVSIEHIYFLPISDIHTENRAFENGQLHKTYELPSETIARHRGTPEYRNDPFLSVYYYMINTTVEPLDDPRVRKALSLAIDRQSITDDIVRRGETPATGYTPPGFKGYNPPRNLEYNPAKAAELLASAGFPNGEGFPVKTILFNNHAGHQAIAEAIQQMWKQVLNINVELANQEWKVYLETRNRMGYDIARAGWGGDFMDPSTFLRLWTTEGEGDSLNDTGWSNPEYDRLLQEANLAETVEKRYENLEEAEEILIEELPNIPIYWYRRPYLLDTRVKGWEVKLLDFHNYKYLSFEQPTS